MKVIFSLMLLMLVNGIVFSQEKLEDGIYLIDQSAKKKSTDPKFNRAAIQFNEYFVDDDPQDYDPIVVATDDYVPLELKGTPMLQKDGLQRKSLSLQLTTDATKKLTTFTSNISGKYVVIVINGEALTVHKINNPVTIGYIQFSKCRGSGCDYIYSLLKKRVKA